MPGKDALGANMISQNVERSSEGGVMDLVYILHCRKVGIEDSLPDCRGGTPVKAL